MNVLPNPSKRQLTAIAYRELAQLCASLAESLEHGRNSTETHVSTASHVAYIAANTCNELVQGYLQDGKIK